MTDSRSTILVLHPSSLDPNEFLQRITSSTPGSSSSTNPTPPNGEGYSSIYPWDIDNKYYTASVAFRAVPQELYAEKENASALGEGVEVVMYLFHGKISSLPPALVRVMVNPRDIALAIRLHPNGEAQAASSSSETRKREKDGAELEDLFDEIGMEYLDETEIPEDDDERPIPIVERIRQTLMTHMWPNMVRKPLASSSRGVDEYLDLDDDLDDLDENEQMDQAEASTTVFPISFDPTAHATDAMPVIPDTDIQARDFPGVDELRSQIMLQHLDLENGNTNFRRGQEGFNRLEMLDDDGDDFLDQEAEGDGEDWVQAEYCRLDDWLEEGEGEEGQVTNMTGRHDGGPELENKDNAERDEDEIDQPPNPAVEESQFEDDFADFAPFQSAPPPGGSRAAGGNLPLDPTPLLLHLQNVREELAEMDEDTRRARAGKEVESLFRSLGLGGMDDMEGLLDEDGDEDGEGGEELGEALREIKVDGNEK